MALHWLLRLLSLQRDHQRLAGDELRSMSDRELTDIGIGRSEIAAVLAAGEPAPPAATSRGTGARKDGSPAAFRAGLSASGAACPLRRA
jgi:uncharacterized protein YjiS (DUF1127 family)